MSTHLPLPPRFAQYESCLQGLGSVSVTTAIVLAFALCLYKPDLALSYAFAPLAIHLGLAVVARSVLGVVSYLQNFLAYSVPYVMRHVLESITPAIVGITLYLFVWHFDGYVGAEVPATGVGLTLGVFLTGLACRRLNGGGHVNYARVEVHAELEARRAFPGPSFTLARDTSSEFSFYVTNVTSETSSTV